MRIVASDIALNSSKIDIATHTTSERLRIWNENSEQRETRETKDGKIAVETASLIDRVELSQQALQAVSPAVPPSDTAKKDPFDDEFIGDFKSRVIKSIVEAMTGKKIKVFSPKEMANSTAESEAPPADTRAGWGIDYEYHETTYTKEGIAFSAKGSVTTADGRTIDFTAALEMSRERYEQIDVSLKAGDALIDPLMIDLAGSGAGFTDVKFSFDLDADGTQETVAAPKAGTGFLALDVNGNGVIDDGSELFGPQTGNGFEELAALDGDGNGWIDEGDASFDKLSIWQKGAAGNDAITTLRESGVGALYTGKASTLYALNSSSNRLTGMLRESGVYLRENGSAGFLQEVDLVA